MKKLLTVLALTSVISPLAHSADFWSVSSDFSNDNISGYDEVAQRLNGINTCGMFNRFAVLNVIGNPYIYEERDLQILCVEEPPKAISGVMEVIPEGKVKSLVELVSRCTQERGTSSIMFDNISGWGDFEYTFACSPE